MSTAWRASVVPTASMRSRMMPAAAAAISTGTALGLAADRGLGLALGRLRW